MRTIKLVVIGPSGVGKTSIRGKYISGRFSAAYRATIGADFISKTFPHPNEPDQSVTLQIWDTAGQERFSSLSSAFFRGADAVLLMFDVNSPETMASLRKWWMDFCNQAPLADEDVDEFPCIVVGNKIDMISADSTFVTESEALVFLDSLVPSSSSSPRIADVVPPNLFPDPSSPPRSNIPFPISPDDYSLLPHPRTTSIDITPSPQPRAATSSPSYSPKHRLSKSHSRASSSRFYSGTMTTTHTTLSIYHTPSSSVFDMYESARSSPEPRLSLSSSAPPPSHTLNHPNLLTPSSTSHLNDQNVAPVVPALASSPPARTRRTTNLSNGSASSGSGVTITPSLFARESAAAAQAQAEAESRAALLNTSVSTSFSRVRTSDSSIASPITIQHSPSLSSHSFMPTSATSTTTNGNNVAMPFSIMPLPLPPERGPRLFFASAKTGQGVDDIFGYIVQRVLRKWEYEDEVEARRLHFRDASGGSVRDRLGVVRLGRRGLAAFSGLGGDKREAGSDRAGWNGCC